MKQFKEGFMIGVSTAAHQVEGNNKNCDFWTLENIPGSSYVEPSLEAVDHYNRYREDIDLLARAGLNAYRFSIEWARIEPIQGTFDKKEVEHYKDVLNYCHEKSVTPIVTLHHFSSPKWLISEGGWESENTVESFGKYCEYIITELGDLIPYVCTINEANMGVQIGRIMKEYMKKMMAAQATSQAKTVSSEDGNKEERKTTDVQVGINLQHHKAAQEAYNKAVEEAFGVPGGKIHGFLDARTKEGELIIMKCHVKAREVIKSIHPEIKVGLTMSLYDYQAQPGGEQAIADLWNEDFHQYFPYFKEDDFFGVQNYTRKMFGPEGKIEPDADAKMTEMGNEYYPKALYGVLCYVSNYWDKPIMVTENGISTKNDEDRVAFIKETMEYVYQSVEEGINLLGYMHWSLLDNFEWQKGYDQRFGLIAVDRTTQTRHPKESLKVLGSIRKNGLE